MADHDFTQDMDAEQIKRAKAAGKLAQKHIKGTTLYEAIEVGEVLLNGRAIAMRVSNSNAPSGRRYAEAFGAWKRQFGFDVKGQELPPQYLENCIAVAEHRRSRRGNHRQANRGPARRHGHLGPRRARAKGDCRAMKDEDKSEDEKDEDEENERQRRKKVDGDLVLKVLSRHGLSILIDGENSELTVNDENRFAAWCAQRRSPVLTIEGKDTDPCEFEDINED